MNSRTRSSKIVVWHIISNRWNSAITEYAISCAKSLQVQGIDNVFSALDNSPAHQRAQAGGLHCESFASFGLSDLPKFRRVFNKIEPNLVMLYGGKETFLSQLLPCNKGFKVIRFKGDELSARFNKRPFLLRLAGFHLDHYIAPNRKLAVELGSLQKNTKVSQINLGINEKHFFYRPCEQEAKATRPQLLLLGRLDPIKGHEAFLAIFAATLRIWPSGQNKVAKPRLKIVGQAANLSVDDIKNLILKENIEGDVDLVSERLTNVGDEMRKATIGVVSSLGSELICRVSQEFLLCGTPVFCSGAGALSEVLFEDSGTDYRNLDTQEAAKLLKAQILSSWFEPSSKKAARSDHAKSLYSFEAMGKSMLKLFDEHQLLGV